MYVIPYQILGRILTISDILVEYQLWPSMHMLTPLNMISVDEEDWGEGEALLDGETE